MCVDAMYATKSVGDGGLGLEAATAAIRSCLAFSSLSYPQQNPHIKLSQQVICLSKETTSGDVEHSHQDAKHIS
jgi:hypothetical protein